MGKTSPNTNLGRTVSSDSIVYFGYDEDGNQVCAYPTFAAVAHHARLIEKGSAISFIDPSLKPIVRWTLEVDNKVILSDAMKTAPSKSYPKPVKKKKGRRR